MLHDSLTWLAQFLFGAWLGWCLWNVLELLVAPFLVDGPCTNGLWIRVPARVRAALDADELAAVLAHEMGHIARWHVPANLVRRCFLVSDTLERRRQQELEADDYAVAHGHGAALARVLKRFGRTPFDRARARRLLGIVR